MKANLIKRKIWTNESHSQTQIKMYRHLLSWPKAFFSFLLKRWPLRWNKLKLMQQPMYFGWKKEVLTQNLNLTTIQICSISRNAHANDENHKKDTNTKHHISTGNHQGTVLGTVFFFLFFSGSSHLHVNQVTFTALLLQNSSEILDLLSSRWHNVTKWDAI